MDKIDERLNNYIMWMLLKQSRMQMAETILNKMSKKEKDSYKPNLKDYESDMGPFKRSTIEEAMECNY